MSKYVELDNEEDEQYSTDGAICPYCGFIVDPDDDNYNLYDDSTCEYKCHSCNKRFNVEVYISHSWTTRKIKKGQPMTSKKIIVRGCPALTSLYKCDSDEVHRKNICIDSNTACICQDITDCKIKKVIKKCKKESLCEECNLEGTNKCNEQCISFFTNDFAQEILKLLDVQEVEL